ncbi:MAG: HpcH/HpaI aldolase family protein [Gammaproteobacteria bacterium]
MTKKNINLKTKIKNNNLTLGSWITLYHPAIAEIMANSGFDWLTVDLEHSVISIREAEELIRVISLSGVSPLVRLTSNDRNQIKRVMDAGSHGIIVPMVNSAEEARKAVEAVHYPSEGKRGVGLARAQGYGTNLETYMKWLKDESIIIVQIEDIKAVDNLEEIFSVNNIDGYIIGPYDLSASMGIPGEFDNPKFIDVVNKIRSTASNCNMCGGIHIIEPKPEELEKRIDDGYRFLAYSLDIRMLDVSCKNGIQYIKELEI